MTALFTLILVQMAIGGFDNVWHHEITERIRHNPRARDELAVHTLREWVYGVIFVGLAWWQWTGWWALVLAGLFAAEIAITVLDIRIEAGTRKLPPLERWLHLGLVVNLAAILIALVPVVWRWQGQSTGFVAVDYGVMSRLLTVAGVAGFGLAIRDTVATVRLTALQVPDWLRRPIRRGDRRPALHVLVTGATGFIGGALVRALVGRGDRVTVLTRDAAKAAYKFGPHADIVTSLDDIGNDAVIDAVVNLAGESLAAGLWTKARKTRIYRSRIETTRAVAALIGRLDKTPGVLISASGVGYYGDNERPDNAETAGAGRDPLARLCYDWERAAREAEAYGVRVCRYRIGVVLGRGGGPLPVLARAARAGLAPVFGDGRQVVSWIARDDLVRLVLFGLDDARVAGPINATAPMPLRQRDFARAIGDHFGSRFVGAMALRVPRAVLGVAGDAASLVLGGQRATPGRARRLGFRFDCPDLDAALRHIDRAPSRKAAATATPLTVFYNSGCPICRGEMAQYDRQARRHAAALSFQDIQLIPEALAAYGITRTHVEQRLYVLDVRGRPHGGLDAMIAIWSRLPGYRRLARVMAWPGIHGLGAAIYDGFLAAWVRRLGRRMAARQHKNLLPSK